MEASESARLKTYVVDGIRQRYDVMEQERHGLDALSEPCFFMHGGRWDSTFDDLSDKIMGSITGVARNEGEADTLLDAVFREFSFYIGDCGGDHHSGYFEDHNVATAPALSLVADIEKLRECLKS